MPTLAIIDRVLSMPIGLFVILGAVAVVGIIFGAITKIVVSRSAERTRREIAAYVAEGTIEPDKAVALLKAGRDAEEDDE